MSDDEINYFEEGESFRGYKIVRLLGRGGIGAVYLARHDVLDTYYAIKILYPRVSEQDRSQVKRFLREARLATRIRHPNLVSVHDCGYDEVKKLYFLVMDYVSGGSLRQALAFEGKFQLERAADIVAQVAMALNASQAYQMVHRDIKPENIMIQPDGQVKLVDLGIAKAQNLGDSVKTNTDSTFGTPAYLSPEQAISSTNVDLRADIYSLGIVFFEMLTGRCPYNGRSAAEVLAQILTDEPTPDIRDVCPGASVEAAILIRRMTVKDVDRRISSYDEVLSGLKRLGCKRVAPQPSTVELAAKPEVGMRTLLNSVNAIPEKPTKRKGIISFFKKLIG